MEKNICDNYVFDDCYCSIPCLCAQNFACSRNKLIQSHAMCVCYAYDSFTNFNDYYTLNLDLPEFKDGLIIQTAHIFANRDLNLCTHTEPLGFLRIEHDSSTLEIVTMDLSLIPFCIYDCQIHSSWSAAVSSAFVKGLIAKTVKGRLTRPLRKAMKM